MTWKRLAILTILTVASIFSASVSVRGSVGQLPAPSEDAPSRAGTTGIRSPSLPATSNDPSAVGQWAAPFGTPNLSVNMVLLNTGKVLQYQRGNDVNLFDPATNSFTSIPNSWTNLFCSGHSVLADGR